MESGTPTKGATPTALEAGELAVRPTRQYHPVVRFLRGNLTPFWLFSSIYVIYFLATLGFPHVGNDGAVMDTHIPMAFLFVVCCVWNLYHTPSHGDLYRRLHKIVGWAAMIVGFCSVSTGYAYILGGGSHAGLGTKILMMAIGLIQLVLQCLGVWYVKGYRWIDMHMQMMTYLFYMSGVLIAINWLPKMATGNAPAGKDAANWMFVSMLSSMYIAYKAMKATRYKLWETDLRIK